MAGEELPSPLSNDPPSERLARLLDLEKLRHSMRQRCKDMRKNMRASRQDLRSLAAMTDYVSEKESFRLQESISSNTLRFSCRRCWKKRTHSRRMAAATSGE